MSLSAYDFLLLFFFCNFNYTVLITTSALLNPYYLFNPSPNPIFLVTMSVFILMRNSSEQICVFPMFKWTETPTTLIL